MRQGTKIFIPTKSLRTKRKQGIVGPSAIPFLPFFSLTLDKSEVGIPVAPEQTGLILFRPKNKLTAVIVALASRGGRVRAPRVGLYPTNG